ncbi:MAG TPA: CBS domain-containing protein [Solirubrobacteraceae bacterium]|nr:CBS domain-containing protein [Solirubrobacteraceae bacterium]
MRVRDGMSAIVVTVRPGHSLRDAARAMDAKKVGAAVVVDPDGPGIGIITERDLLSAVAAGQDPDTERVGDHQSSGIVFAAPEWSLEEAAVAMVQGGFRHLVVCEDGEVAGVLAMRDIVRVWTADGSICEVPASAGFGAAARA